MLLLNRGLLTSPDRNKTKNNELEKNNPQEKKEQTISGSPGVNLHEAQIDFCIPLRYSNIVENTKKTSVILGRMPEVDSASSLVDTKKDWMSTGQSLESLV